MNDTNENLSNACKAIGNMPIKNGPPHSNDTTIKSGIYGLRCKTTNKWYVGQSTDIVQRWGDYGRLCCKKQPKLYRALLKYGYGDFDKVILEGCPVVVDILNDREVFWSNQYDSVNNGYNTRECGGARGKHSEETKIKMSISAKNISPEIRIKMAISQIGKQHSEKTKQKLSEISKNMSEDTKNKMSLAAKGKPKKPFSAEHRANLSASRVGKKHTEETKAKISSIQKGNRPWAKDIAIEMSRRNVGRKQSPETIAKRMATIKANRLSKISNIDNQSVVS